MSKTFEQVKLLYEQALNLELEIKSYVDSGDLNTAISKSLAKEEVFKNLKIIRDSQEFSQEEKAEIERINKSLTQISLKNINYMKKISKELKKEIKKENDKEKMNVAYGEELHEAGKIVDFKE